MLSNQTSGIDDGNRQDFRHFGQLPADPILPGGTFILTESIDDRVRAACQAPARIGTAAHPINAFVMALRGPGLPIADIYRRVGAEIADGPVAASCAIDFDGALTIGTTYRISARIEQAEIKPSRRFGRACHFVHQVAMDPVGAPSVAGGAVITLRTILPPHGAGTTGSTAATAPGMTLPVTPPATAPVALTPAAPMLRWSLPLVEQWMMDQWAALLDDPNPIHLDPAASAALGFGPRTVNQGPANLGYALNLLLDHWPNRALRHLSARFLGNVFCGDHVAAIADVGPDADGRVAIVLERDGGAPVLTLEAVLATGGETGQ